MVVHRRYRLTLEQDITTYSLMHTIGHTSVSAQMEPPVRSLLIPSLINVVEEDIACRLCHEKMEWHCTSDRSMRPLHAMIACAQLELNPLRCCSSI